MGEPRAVTVTLGDIRSLTILEIARAGVTAGVNRADTEGLLRSLVRPDSPPEDLERGALLMYAWAWQLTKRDEPQVTWDEAQTWRVTFDLDASDPIAEAEADATVRAAALTGLPLEEAAKLTVAEVDVYAELAASR